MRLNNGMPVWHVSVTVWTPDRRTRLNKPLQAEAEAIRLLRGVGDPEREWWVWDLGLVAGRMGRWVGHLRVPVTPQEYDRVPPGCASHDAGESGPLRKRRR
jgi:hypothetical protein